MMRSLEHIISTDLAQLEKGLFREERTRSIQYLQDSWADVLKMASGFLEKFDTEKDHGFTFVQTVVSRISGWAANLVSDPEVSHYLLVNETCHNHAYPTMVARALIPTEPDAGDIGAVIQEARQHYSRSQFLYSHHDENLDRGRISCRRCGGETDVHYVGRVMLFRPKVDKPLLEQSIIKKAYAELSQWFEDEKDLYDQISSAVGVGSDYLSLYDALDQTILLTVNLSDLVREHLDDLPKKSIFKNPRIKDTIIQSISEAAEQHIPSKHIFISYGIKGESFPDKFILQQHTPVLQQAYESGELQDFMESKGIDFRRRPSPRDLSDLHRIRVIFSGAQVPADIRDFDREALAGGEEQAYSTLYSLAEHLVGRPLSDIRPYAVRYGDLVSNITKHIGSVLVLLTEEQKNALIDLVSKQDRRLIRSAPIYEREGIAYTTIEPFIISKYREKIGHMVPDEEVVLIKKPEPHAGIFVNWVDEDAFEDYISDQDRDYNALHLRIETAPSSWGDRVYAAEFQAKTTLEDALQEDAQQQSHEAYRNWQLAMVEFLIDKGYMGITRRRTNGDLAPEDLAVAQEEGRARAYLIRRLLSPNQVYHHYAYGT